RYGHVTGVQTCALPIYTLIGNPYASPVNFQTMKSHNTAITDRFWTFDATLSTYGAYRLIYNDGNGNYLMIPNNGSAVSAGNYVKDRKSTRLNSSHVAIS